MIWTLFAKLMKFNLLVNLKKCYLLYSEVKYLGHILLPKGISVDPEKINAIVNSKVARNGKELISFIQTGSWSFSSS